MTDTKDCHDCKHKKTWFEEGKSHKEPSPRTLEEFASIKIKMAEYRELDEKKHNEIMSNMITKEQFHDHTVEEMSKYHAIHESIKELASTMISKSFITVALSISGVAITIIGALLWYIFQGQVIDRMDKIENKVDNTELKVDTVVETMIRYDFDISPSNDSMWKS